MKKKYFHHDEKTVYLEEVPLSNMLTMENNVKQIAPSPANTRAGNGIITMLGRHLEKESGEEKAE